MTANDLTTQLREACEARTILERAGRHDLAEQAWAALCPPDAPAATRRDALTEAGYPFRSTRPGDPERAPRVLTWTWREQPDLAALDAAASDLSAFGQVWMHDVETGTDEYAVVVSVGEITDEQALRLYLASKEG